MKYFFTALITLLLCSEIQAQELTAGLRTGASYWWQNKNSETFHFETVDGHKYSWDQEIFLHLNTKKHWAFEVGFINNKQNSYADEAVYTNNHYYAFNVSTQYDITCHYLKKCPVLKHLRSFIGINIDPVFIRTTATPSTNIIAQGYELNYNEHEFHIWAGLSHTLTYDITKHWQLSSVACFKIYPENYFGGISDGPTTIYDTYLPSSNLSLRIGAAYRLN